jgi:hypothetical protein
VGERRGEQSRYLSCDLSRSPSLLAAVGLTAAWLSLGYLATSIAVGLRPVVGLSAGLRFSGHLAK